MKQIIYIAILFVSTLSFGQSTGIIAGRVLDNEAQAAPLEMANITVKNTSINVTTDLNGSFIIKNLEPGEYILSCSFNGYETQTLKVVVDAFTPIEVKLTLAASTISLSDLNLLTATSSQKEDKSTSSLN